MNAELTEENVKSLFSMAGFEVKKLWKLENQYYGGGASQRACEVEIPRVYIQGETLLDYAMLEFINSAVPAFQDPWWLVKTQYGLIEIGWRKRVIQIDWSETSNRVQVTSDQVTQSETMVHAWGIDKALTYLMRLQYQLSVHMTLV